MSSQSLFHDTNEEHKERLALVTERMKELAAQGADAVPGQYRQYFVQTAELLLLQSAIAQRAADGLSQLTKEEGQDYNQRLFSDIQGEGYEKSYANPSCAGAQLGEYAQLLCALNAEIHGISRRAFDGDYRYVCIYAELFVEIYNCFEAGADKEEISGILYSFMHDYADLFCAEKIRRMILPAYDRIQRLVMDSDLSDTAYLYRYGLYIGEDERKISEFLAGMKEEELQAMADTFTEGFRIGFITTGKDISIKSVVQISYPIGFERMVRAAVKNFAKLGLNPVMAPYSASADRQFAYDHKEDEALWLDNALIQRRLEVRRLTWEKYKEQAPQYAGPAVVETFGIPPFSPEQKPGRLSYSEKQQELTVYETGEELRLCNEAIHGEERSFTIIAYPLPSIGERFAEIFAETVKINTLDYNLYQTMQQKLIDLLDTADRVHIVGTNGNRTDLYVKIHDLKDPEKETAFENCVADVNIPVGEVFTSPTLKGTEGKLHVSQVYLNELNFLNLELDFAEGQICAYNCTNFATEQENKKYIEDNVLFHHKTLPMGEFAIGTNTAAYRMARVYDIADKLPILIAEKTGPHFAVGDTCYTYEEDNMTYNPDGKAIVARENELTAPCREDRSKAYFNCHTDITIPYDELGAITVIRKDGTQADVIRDGRFVVEGTEALNEPLDALLEKGE
ncbi:MAG: aminopeptidase [Blautia sp.]|nr:aminopeptidase [Blautia sp.]